MIMDQAPRAPESFPRRVLLAVTGLSPQVLTETLYALSVKRHPTFVPTEIHVITTGQGAERVRMALLSKTPGWFHRLCEDYKLPGMRFDQSTVHCMTDETGQPLSDIRNPSDNIACADFVTQKLREITADPNCAVHVSIAGGRKTMGFLLGYALAIFGRPQDRLSHVLVSEPYENSWDFFYPTPYEHIIEGANQNLMDASQAIVELAEIPLFSLRPELPGSVIDADASFERTVAVARTSLAAPALDLYVTRKTVVAAGIEFRIPPAELALLLVFARHARSSGHDLPAPHKDVPDPDWAQNYLKELKSIVGTMADISNTERALRAGMDGHYFSSRLSKLRRCLKGHLGSEAGPYLIDDGGKKPHRYRILLNPENIRIHFTN